MKVLLLGGPYNRCRGDLSATPPRIVVGATAYERIDDPDTGEYLGGYVATSDGAGETRGGR